MRQLTEWLGQGRTRALLLLFGTTGLLSLVLQLTGSTAAWVIPMQNLLLLLAVGGTVVIFFTRLDPLERRLLLISVGPLLAGVGAGVFVPALLPWFGGAGLGWLLVSQFLLRRNVRREYQQAIRHLRKDEYPAAIAILDKLVEAEPENTGHLSFRANLLRLQGAFDRAIQDYQQIIALEPTTGLGYNGLAEVYLQRKQPEQALDYAQQAYEQEPDEWVIAYNRGMIEQRLIMWDEALTHLQEALALGVPDSRHRLLIHLWLAQANAALGRLAVAGEHLTGLRQEQRGLKEWESIFASKQAQTLQLMLADDIALAQQISAGAGIEILAPAAADEDET